MSTCEVRTKSHLGYQYWECGRNATLEVVSKGSKIGTRMCGLCFEEWKNNPQRYNSKAKVKHILN